MSFENIREEYREELTSLPHYESDEITDTGTDIFVMFKPDFIKNSDINMDGDIEQTGIEVEAFLKNEIDEAVDLSFLVIIPGLLEEQIVEIYKDTYWEKFLKPLYIKIQGNEASEKEVQKYNEHLQFFCGGEGPLALLVLNTPYSNKEQALNYLLEWRNRFRENYLHAQILPNNIYINGIHVDTLDNASNVLLQYGYNSS